MLVAGPAGAAYVDVISGDNPLAYYRLNETGAVPTTAVDATTNGNDATYQSQLVLGAAGPRPSDGFAGFATTNNAPSFNQQANDYIAMPSGFLPTGSAKRTIEGWFYSDDDTANQDQRFFNYGPNATGDRVTISAANTRVAVAVSGHNWGKDGLSLGAGWHHLAVVFPAGQTLSNKWKLYVDGAELTGLTTLAGGTTTVTSVDSNQWIGRDSGAATYDGRIDEVAIYNTDLSADKIRDHYLAATGYGSNVLIHDHFLNGNLATGGPDSVNGGFKMVTNGSGGSGAASESGTVATADTTLGGTHNNTGIVSNNTFDPTADPTNGFTVTWVVTSASNPTSNGINLTLQSGDDFFNWAGGRPNLLFRFDHVDDQKFHLLANDGSTEVELATLDPITMSEVLDGFTLTATLNSAGWSYSATGLDSLADNSGSWGGATHDYDSLFDSDTFVGAFIQGSDKTLSIDRITVRAVPEPTTLALAAMGLLGLRRRRRRA